MKESEKDIYSWYKNVENFEVNDLLENTIHEEALTNEQAYMFAVKLFVGKKLLTSDQATYRGTENWFSVYSSLSQYLCELQIDA